MKKVSAILLALAMLLSAAASAETVLFEDYGFFIKLPEDWVYEESEMTEEYEEAGVVYGIDAHSEDESVVMWLEIYAFAEESVAATDLTLMEFEGHLSDLQAYYREYFPDMSYFTVNNVPFIYYTATDEEGSYLTAYTWTISHQFGFVFFAEELTDEVRATIAQIMDTYTAL